MPDNLVGLNIKVSGIVQGVGFRPFIYLTATKNQVTGWVRNTSSGVEIQIQGLPENVDAFQQTINLNPPPLARIDRLEIIPATVTGFSTFEILASEPEPGEYMPVSPDVSICEDCRHEIFDPADRRYRYPFNNCTNCGPRFSIIRDIPYDRQRTTMAGFSMCPDCRKEYEDPLNRRFHAQPVACAKCGPNIWFEPETNGRITGEEALQLARTLLKEGGILAVKGLGGYHLACDATSERAVATLRQRKLRVDKPFALMAFNSDVIQKYCSLSKEEGFLLESPQHPIVLLDRLVGCPLPGAIAPGQSTLGFMLPYTPLHLLLLEPASGFPDVLVMTSGNLSEEPICYEDDSAHQHLASLADGFLFHDRPIEMRIDDSVARVINTQPVLLRRARGYAPNPLRMPLQVEPILATGSHLKNTFCLARDEYAFLSHHIGDLENYETLRSFEDGVAHFERLFRFTPQILACDLHPDYLASQYAHDRSQRDDLSLIEVQHHHAHLAACLGDNGWNSTEPVIGFCFDGTGYGTDGATWGSEVLFGGYRSFDRLFHLSYTPLPGGDAAIHHPSRIALAYLWHSGIEWETDLAPVQALKTEERILLKSLLDHGFHSPPSSSMGRLFDAISALIGIRQTCSYEGQAAIELENLADPSENGEYPIQITGDQMVVSTLFESLLLDLRKGTPPGTMSSRFHNSVVSLIVKIARLVRAETDCKVIALSGGVWQNRYLLKRSLQQLSLAGFTILFHRNLPANDGCISFGQALVANARVKNPF